MLSVKFQISSFDIHPLQCLAIPGGVVSSTLKFLATLLSFLCFDDSPFCRLLRNGPYFNIEPG